MGRLTPIMEACSNGDFTMAELLFKEGGKVNVTNANGWTPVDFLRNYLNTNQEFISESDASKIRHLINKMEEKQRKCNFTNYKCNNLSLVNFPTRSVPPPIKSSQKPISNMQPKQLQKKDEGKKWVRDYQNAMKLVNRNRNYRPNRINADGLNISSSSHDDFARNFSKSQDELDPDGFLDFDDALFKNYNNSLNNPEDQPTTSTQIGSPVPFHFNSDDEYILDEASRKRVSTKKPGGSQTKRMKPSANAKAFFH